MGVVYLAGICIFSFWIEDQPRGKSVEDPCVIEVVEIKIYCQQLQEIVSH